MPHFGMCSSHGPNGEYINMNVPIGICRELGIKPGTLLRIESVDSNSFLVGVVRGK